jgi:hypothetical protein
MPRRKGLKRTRRKGLKRTRRDEFSHLVFYVRTRRDEFFPFVL